MSNNSISLQQLEKEMTEDDLGNIDMDKITNKLYLGGLSASADVNKLKQLGITNVISLCGNLSIKYKKEDKIQQKIFNIDDYPCDNIIQYFKQCIEIIQNSEGKTLCHCQMGFSRSATIVIAYIMFITKSGFKEAYDYVLDKRSCMQPNVGFEQQLKLFEELLTKNDYNLEKIKFEEIKWEKNIEDFY
ncbi:MAG: dual specificity protein phosphatase family protein [archaeon]|nr:dual specificity protein phosphatase family protein [archaeon]